MNESTAPGAVRSVRPFRVTGRVELVRGLLLEATIPGARVGEVATITDARVQVLAEVVGFAGARVQLLPLGSAAGLGEGAEVACGGESLTIGVGSELVGRVLDGLGRPMDGKPPPPGLVRWSVPPMPGAVSPGAGGCAAPARGSRHRWAVHGWPRAAPRAVRRRRGGKVDAARPDGAAHPGGGHGGGPGG